MKKTIDHQGNGNYSLDSQGSFVIEQYNHSAPFSNFFPGIAGVWGVPMWVFYVNRGQCIASFGVETKDKAIMEFQPANKAYRLVSLQGFRTFMKVREEGREYYWEPFQNYLKGTNYKKDVKLSITSHDLTLQEVNEELGLKVIVNYFTLPEESYSALIRRVTIINLSDKNYEIDMLDGLPMIMPYGLTDPLVKNISRTIEAWINVCGIESKTPYYQLKVEVSDKPEVKHIKEGNFFFSFDSTADDKKLLSPIVEAATIFGGATDFIAPEQFLKENFNSPQEQQTRNRTPCAMSYTQFSLPSKERKAIVSAFGYAQSEDKLSPIVSQMTADNFIENKAQLNKKIISDIMNFSLTKSSSPEFDLYASQTFLDNILRGGLPVSVKTSDGYMALNVYSRKHGDLERDYNYFYLASTYFSQGNGNYRDVAQNRRNDAWFNLDVQNSHLIGFLNLSQADGYNPLVVKGTTFSIDKTDVVDDILNKKIEGDVPSGLIDFLKKPFMPGDLLNYLYASGIKLKIREQDFLGMILENCQKQELAEHNEGFWSDHWTYNLDLIESYLSLYPEKLKEVLIEKKVFTFYHDNYFVLPRDQRYLLTEKGIRQYESVGKNVENEDAAETGNILKVKNGQGAPYQTTLVCKLLCLIANKISSLDPSGIGVEMEADKPNWYDSLNGLPGLLGSSISETFEIKRASLFLLESVKRFSSDEKKAVVFEELEAFIKGLTSLLSFQGDVFSYWSKSNDIKEHYRSRIKNGISGREEEMSFLEIKNFLALVIAKVNKGVELAIDQDGFLRTYFYHEVEKYEILDKSKKASNVFVRPLNFKLHILPLFLEGYVHALRVEDNKEKARALYSAVRKSALYDKKLKMYKVNADLSAESEEIGRTRIFPRGWLENESVWLHMEYKFMLELLRAELFEEFYENFRNVLVPFLKPQIYKRSILENSSFIVSSAHEDESLHGQGFVARLSGSTSEFMHIWLYMNGGLNPFSFNAENRLVLTLSPILEGSLFTEKETTIQCLNSDNQSTKITLPKNIYAFNFLSSCLIVYHNSKRGNTFGKNKVLIKEMQLSYRGKTKPVVLSFASIPAPYSEDVRNRKVERIDIFLE